MAKQKVTASELDGVQYRRAKLWQIILYACNGFVGMSIYSLINLASYSASIGYGIATAALGIILTCTRILDGVTDPLLAFVYDRVNTRFGKLRVLMVSGFAIEAIALLCMFNFMSSKGFGWPVFTIFYVIYVIGYTITNMTAQTIPAIMTNDPKQRPTVGVWSTAFNYLVPMIMMMVLNMVLLPMFGGTYSFIDKIITAFSAVIATTSIMVVGYTHSLPQPSDALTPGIFWLTLALKFGLPLVGWAITLIAMRDCPLTKEGMVDIQKRIAEKKAAARHAIIEENLK